MYNQKDILIVSLLLVSLLWGCSADYHASKVQKGMEGDQLTVGKVQKEIKIGMPSSEVIEALGSPNVITTDEQRREVWVYDKFATDVAASEGYWTVLFAGQSAGSASQSQRTLTIVIKFDESNKVRDFAYHTSRF
jgi:outer membrane protein assembly factor BamE (lipoprotein component of BamABCDE complex)